MTPLGLRLLRGVLELSCVILAVVTAWNRSHFRPAAIALAAVGALDLVQLAPLSARAAAGLWAVWPAPIAALAWAVWRKSEGPGVRTPRPSPDRRSQPGQTRRDVDFGASPPGSRSAPLDTGPAEPGTSCASGCPSPVGETEVLVGGQHALQVAPWQVVVLVYASYAVALAIVPVRWSACPLAWVWATRAPYWACPALCLFAWAATCRSEQVSVAARVATALGWSSALDVAVGALAREGISWSLAWATSSATWALVAGLILWDIQQLRRPSCQTTSSPPGS